MTGRGRWQFLALLFVGGLVMVSASAAPVSVTLDGQESAEPGDTVTISPTLTNTGDNESGYILDVSGIPDGWEIANRTDDGGEWKPTATGWLYLNVDAGASVEPSLTLSVPEDADNATQELTVEARDDDGIQDVASQTITVEAEHSDGNESEGSDDGNESADWTVTLDGPESVTSGSNATVSLTLTNTGDNETGYLLEVSEMPDGWEIVNRTDDGGERRLVATDWLYLKVDANASVERSLNISIPEDADNATRELTVEAQDWDGTQDNASQTMTVAVGSDDGAESDGSNASDESNGSDVGENINSIDIPPMLSDTPDNNSSNVLDVVDTLGDGMWSPDEIGNPLDDFEQSLNLSVPENADNVTEDLNISVPEDADNVTEDLNISVPEDTDNVTEDLNISVPENADNVTEDLNISVPEDAENLTDAGLNATEVDGEILGEGEWNPEEIQNSLVEVEQPGNISLPPDNSTNVDLNISVPEKTVNLTDRDINDSALNISLPEGADNLTDRDLNASELNVSFPKDTDDLAEDYINDSELNISVPENTVNLTDRDINDSALSISLPEGAESDESEDDAESDESEDDAESDESEDDAESDESGDVLDGMDILGDGMLNSDEIGNPLDDVESNGNFMPMLNFSAQDNDETSQPGAGEAESSDSDENSDDLNTTAIEQAIHTAVNDEREQRGLDPLAFDSDLAEVARSHSQDMAEREYFSHTSPEGENFSDRYEEFGYDCRVETGSDKYLGGGENIASTVASGTVRTNGGIVNYEGNETRIGHGIVQQWMNSTGHRQNMLRDDWENEGIGVATRETSGRSRVLATQNFC